MSTLYLRQGDVDWILKKASCGFETFVIAVIEKLSGELNVFYRDLVSLGSLHRWKSLDRGVTSTASSSSLKDKSGNALSNSYLDTGIVSLAYDDSLNTFYAVFYYKEEILFSVGTENSSGTIVWASGIVVATNVSYQRPKIVLDPDGGLYVYYTTVNDSLEDITKVKRSNDRGLTWTDVPLTAELTLGNLKTTSIFNTGKVGLTTFNGQNLNIDNLRRTVVDNVDKIERLGSSVKIKENPVHTSNLLVDDAGTYHVAYQSGLGLTLSFAVSNDNGNTWKDS